MLGPGWYGGSGGAASVNRAGSTGQKLHGPGHAPPSYYSGSWSGHPQKLNYSWQLQDVRPQDGGFVLVPVREEPPLPVVCFAFTDRATATTMLQVGAADSPCTPWGIHP